MRGDGGSNERDVTGLGGSRLSLLAVLLEIFSVRKTCSSFSLMF